LGTYGYGEYEEFARNGCNGHACFGRHSKGDLDSHATLKMRGVSTVGDSAPKDYEVGHPGLWAYYLQDEPDCADYGVNELPTPLRIGYHALEMESRRQTCANTDPSKLTFLTIDMTYKPANYFIYGPVADVLNPDCYPISLGADATMVREVVETARRGCGPRPLTFTFQGCYEERLDPKDREALRFPRPPFAEEERLMMYYAIGAGARGLFDYIHCSEMWSGGKVMSHGSKEYPDVWEEIGRVYRELQVVSPYLSLAHPTRLATSSNPKLDVSTLLCGEDALLLVCINDDYEQQKQAFKYRSAKEVTLEIPKIPWMRPQSAWRITEHGVKPVALKRGQGTTSIEMDQVDVAEMLLVSSNPRAGEELNAANLKRQQEVGAALLAQERNRQLAEATRHHIFRRLMGEFGDYMVMGTGIEAYGSQEPRFWNPANEPYWGFEFGDNEAGRDSQKGAEWRMKIPAERVGKQHLLYAVAAAWGQPAVLTVLSPQGEEVAKREVGGGGSGSLIILKLRCPIAGDCTVRFLQAGKGPKGGKITHALYVIPEDANPPSSE
ncbi:MAG: hypothetical protein HY318_10975, partial [Armatimonadetes bacterium]|nr:hypothetical protein [Armatimonadota bacterium]